MRAIWCNTNTNTDGYRYSDSHTYCERDANNNGYTKRNTNTNCNGDAVRGEMYTDAEAAPHSSAAAQSLRPK